jgi:hypothetical protein
MDGEYRQYTLYVNNIYQYGGKQTILKRSKLKVLAGMLLGVTYL